VDPEDSKIIKLARLASTRMSAPEGAAVRDENGRTYAAGPVALPSLRLSALQVAVAMAVASGAQGLEAAARVGAGEDPGGLAAVKDLAAAAPIFVADPDGTVRATL
jgi:hypothetical protein